MIDAVRLIGLRAGVLAPEVARDDEDRLLMDLAAHLGFPLDVDDACFADIGAGGDARRLAETVVPEVEHGEAVDLSYLFPGRADDETCPRGSLP